MFMSIYYNLIMFASFQFPLPWSNCLSLPDSNCSTTPKVYCNVSGVLVINWTQENTTCPSSDTITVPMQSPKVLTTCLSDAFRENFKSKRTSLTIGTCVTVFLLGLPCVTRIHQIYWQ
ncbi:hypothetical protein KUCAC02_030079 [Chaenocephalus aceratus]|uniref:Uncharacterized protein n=1 Tax=Chaenocephalus aceratus TaxID=36190 RepID=A0ACB9XHT6_CHAAC|nr:hypothetical protein KUCAC02_030079 [Chaenocephalus aceratus]